MISIYSKEFESSIENNLPVAIKIWLNACGGTTTEFFVQNMEQFHRIVEKFHKEKTYYQVVFKIDITRKAKMSRELLNLLWDELEKTKIFPCLVDVDDPMGWIHFMENLCLDDLIDKEYIYINEPSYFKCNMCGVAPSSDGQLELGSY